MPTEMPMTPPPSRRPWWVVPGLGALLGAIAIAVVAQGSFAGTRVALPSGPHLARSSADAHRTTVTAPAASATVVTPDLPVVTQTAPSDGAGGTPGSSGSSSSSGYSGSPGSGTSTGSGSDGAHGSAGGSTAPPAASPAVTSTPTDTPTTVDSSTTSTTGTPTPTTTTTTRPSDDPPGDH